MTAPDLAVVAIVNSEVEANLLVSALRDEGFDAAAMGGFTAGFVVGVPGSVKVLVPADQSAGAREWMRNNGHGPAA